MQINIPTRISLIQFHPYGVPRRGSSRKTVSYKVGNHVLGRRVRAQRRPLLSGSRALVWDDKNILEMVAMMAHNIANAPNATDPYTLNSHKGEFYDVFYHS